MSKNDNVSEIYDKINSLHTQQAVQTQILKSINYELQGNGKKGLIKKVDELINWKWMLSGGLTLLSILVGYGFIKP